MTKGQIVSGAGIVAGSVISSIVSATVITISNPATATANAVKLAFGSSTPEGQDTLIAGSGNSELFAGSGGDVLIGCTAILQTGQYVLESGAGRDLLEGGSGNDLLIAGPGSPGSVLMAGSGNDILVGQNDGSNIMVGYGSGNDLFLGFAGSNDINAFGTSGNDTLVGGTGFNSLFGGDGTDWIYDYPNQASWNQAIQQAAALHVQLASPIGWNPGGSSSSLWNLLDSLETEPQQFTSAQRTSLASLLSQDYKALGITNPTGAEVETQLYDEATQSTPNNGAQLAGWLEEDPTSHNDLEQILLSILETPGQGLSLNQRYLWVNMLSADLQNLSSQEANVAAQIVALANIEDTFIPGSETAVQFTFLTNESDTLSKAEELVSKLLGSPDAADSLQAGNGVDYVYGNPSLPTWMAGGEGQDTFYNFNDSDTVLGGKGADNTLMFRGTARSSSSPTRTTQPGSMWTSPRRPARPLRGWRATSRHPPRVSPTSSTSAC